MATLENPPGNEEKGSAWLLPEIKKFMGNVGMEKADFNTCAYQDTKRRWKKAGRFGGKLSGLAGLSKPCMCPAWVVHEALVGAGKTSAAAEYPEKLAEAYADLVIKIWKKQLQLEWWRNQSDLTSQEVEMLRASEKKRKREERPPEPRGIPRRLEAETQRKREEVAPAKRGPRGSNAWTSQAIQERDPGERELQRHWWYEEPYEDVGTPH